MAADDPDDLYGLPLEEFVAARDSLAKRLRASGDRPAAEAVKGLAKPSAAAWAVNQAVRSQPRAARALWAAGDELVATQERLLAGKADRDALRAATAAQREALAPLLDAARGLLTGGGAPVSETALARVEESLHAAALDPDVRGDVEAGRLTKELRHVGMGTFAAAAAAPSTARGSRSKRAAAGGTKAAGEGKRSGRGRATAPGEAEGAGSAERAGDAKAAGEGKRSGRGAGAAGEGKRAGVGKRGRSSGDAAAAGEGKRGRSSGEREADERRAAHAAARQRVEAARGERAAARDAVKLAREDSREADAQAKAAVRAADAARRDADRATAGAQEAAEWEQAAHDRLDAAEAALRSAREAS